MGGEGGCYRRCAEPPDMRFVMKIISIFGTRPEAVKMCPLVQKLDEHPQIESIVCLSGQHREMLDQVTDLFGIHAQYDLNIMKPGQTLTEITARVLEGFEKILKIEKPNLVLVHGDTSTSFASALAAFYQQVPVGHVEAGLRTYDRYSPFPEEMNRSLTGRIAQLHFAPTRENRENLKKENISRNVFVTGNTVIDAFKTTVKPDYQFKNETLKNLNTARKLILITAHRRENLGRPLENICSAVKKLAEKYPDISFIYPVHLNPKVQITVQKILGSLRNVYLIPPLDVEDMHNLIDRSFLVMTDSGGLQEEAPACGVPVLVLRTQTERPEAVEAGTVKVVGVEREDLVNAAAALIENPKEYEKMAQAVNPYGDGHASERIVEHIWKWKLGEMM